MKGCSPSADECSGLSATTRGLRVLTQDCRVEAELLLLLIHTHKEENASLSFGRVGFHARPIMMITGVKFLNNEAERARTTTVVQTDTIARVTYILFINNLTICLGINTNLLNVQREYRNILLHNNNEQKNRISFSLCNGA